MKKGYQITLGFLTVMILAVITVGTSYSYYSINETQKDPNTLNTTCFNVSFSDGNAISMNQAGNYAYPMSEATALTKTPYTFTITNTCTSSNSSTPIKYNITLNTLTATPSNLTSNIRYKLNQTAPSVVNGTSAMLTSNVYPMSSELKTRYGVDTSYSLGSGTLAAGESKTFKLYLWIDENTGNEIMEPAHTFNGKVLVYNYL